ncbi:MAG: dual specificity protein phosphatase family protein [Planctomycetota bacterium]
MRQHRWGNTMDFDKVFENLFVGSHPESSDDIDGLKELGITAVLNLQTNDDFRYLGIDWPAQRARYFARHLEVRRVPIEDFDDDALREKLPGAVLELDGLLEDDHVVYVHCSAGINRSASVVIGYLHWVRDWSLEEAELYVRKRHDCMPVTGAIRMAVWERRRAT